ncbi:MAG: hypothetical protein HYX68_10790 [Planctomycetes bacterium]|nr:hypothetical protein [Planctomycetota bacterium]
MNKSVSVLALLALFFVAGLAQADTLFGTVRFKDGSKDRGTTAITTSYNNRRGSLDANGNYTLDFGTKVNARVTVYVNGRRYTTIMVRGNTRLNIVVR